MRISKCVIIVVIAGLTMPHAAAALPTQTPPTADDSLSNTREAGCLVKITADPDVLILNPETMQSLLCASSVGLKAAREVLGVDSPWDLVEIRQLDSSPAGPPWSADAMEEAVTRSLEDAYSDQMMAEMERVYSEQYKEQMGLETDEKKETDWGGRPGRSPRTSRRSARSAGRAAGPQIEPDGAQTILVELSVHLPEDARPAAQEFMRALVENLRESLRRAYETHKGQLAELIRYAEDHRDTARDRFDEAIGARPDRTGEGTQLDIALRTMVDLSDLSPEMPFSEAIEILKNAVEPPLPLVVLWKELAESCGIEPATPIDMDGLPRIQLGTALKTLLEAVSGGVSEISYQFDGDVIVVREEEFQTLQPAWGGRVGMDVSSMAALRRDLARDVQRLEIDLTSMEARRGAIQVQIARTMEEVDLAVKEDRVTQQLEEILAMTARALAQEEGQYASQHPALEGSEAIRELREQVARAKIELAKRREEIARSAGGARLEMFNSDLSQIAIDSAEKQAQLGVMRRQLEETQQELVRASKFDLQAARVRIVKEALDIAERRVAELKTRLANLRPPAVAVIGAD